MKSNDILEKKSYPIPEEVLTALDISIKKFANTKNNAGTKRANGFKSAKVIHFKEMERLKSFFKEYVYGNNTDGKEKDEEYELSGGDLMRDFVESGVDRLRATIDSVKKAQKEGGKENAYKKKHEKSADDPTNVNKANVQTNSDEIMSNKTTYSESYMDEIGKMKYLIEYMDNNKNKI